MKTYIRIITLLTIVALLLMSSVVAFAAPAAPPVVDGLLNGTNNVDEGYALIGSSAAGEIYGHRSGANLYFALVVPKSINDNVFDQNGGDLTYVGTAGWTEIRFFSNLVNSEQTTWSVECTGDDTPELTIVQQYAGGVAKNTDPDTVQGDWTSPIDSNTGGATVVASASSLQWSMNHYTGFNMTPYGTSDWKKFKSAYGDPSDTVPPSWAAGIYDTTYNWEWRMIYEIHIDASGTDCEGSGSATPSTVSHHSPTKDGSGPDLPPVTAVTLAGLSVTQTGAEWGTLLLALAMLSIGGITGYLLYRSRITV